MRKQAVDDVIRVPLDKVVANDYNPNVTARKEMELLYVSIKEDGYTMPVVCIYDSENDKYVIVDGFHRYLVMKTHADIYAENDGLLPISVIDKPIAERMESTIRHNRARGKHSVKGNAEVVRTLLELGESKEEIKRKIGLTEEEFVRMAYTTRFAKLFAKTEYSKAQMVVEVKK